MKINSRLVALAYASALAVMAGCAIIEPQVIDKNTPYIPLDGYDGEYEWTRNSSNIVYIGAEHQGFDRVPVHRYPATHELAKQHCMKIGIGFPGTFRLFGNGPSRYKSLRPAKPFFGEQVARHFYWDVVMFRCTLRPPIGTPPIYGNPPEKELLSNLVYEASGSAPV